MEDLYTLSAPVQAGSAITVVGDFEGTPFVTVGTLDRLDPLSLTFGSNPGFLKGDTILLVHNDGARIAEARAEVSSIGQSAGHWAAEVYARGWHLMERRRGGRVATNLKADVRFIQEGESDQSFVTVTGDWINLSESGCLMQSENLLPIGSMVRWRVNIGGGAQATGIATVARILPEESAMALEFLDLTSQTRTALLGVIRRAA